MKKLFYMSGLILITGIFSSCKTHNKDYTKVIHDPALYRNLVHKINTVTIYDIFTPPVAARVFAYSNLAALEVLSNKKTGVNTLAGKITNLHNIPHSTENTPIDFPFASMIALMHVGKNLTFSDELMDNSIDSLKNLAKENGMPDDMYNNSIRYGTQVADSVISWSRNDNYAKTRGTRFELSNLEGHWMPTPPGYFPAVEPMWKTIRCTVMDSATMFPPPGPVPFSKEPGSAFYKMAMEVKNTVDSLDSTKKWIANFWDCNNFKLHISGHAMYATKEMSPVGHWMEITGTISRNNHADFYKTVYSYAGVSMGINDAFICCWSTKYKYDVIRPVSYINLYIDPNWSSYLQTPPFPEYNSAHSTISAAADMVLSRLYTNTAFKDSSERLWGWPDRHFKNVDEAAKEVSNSRFYGGIHYKKSVWDAYEQGKQIGDLVIHKLMLNDPELKMVSINENSK